MDAHKPPLDHMPVAWLVLAMRVTEVQSSDVLASLSNPIGDGWTGSLEQERYLVMHTKPWP